MDHPLISFVLPTKNSMPHLAHAIEGLLAQGIDDYELVVQDGGSQDGTLEYLNELQITTLPGRLRLRSEADRGIGDAYSRGLRRARGDLVWFLASDETLLPLAVERALYWHLKYPSAASIYSGVDIVNSQGNLVQRFLPRPFELTRFMRCEIMATTAGIFNRRVIGNDLYYDDSLETCPDYDFWLRLGTRFGPQELIATPEVWVKAMGTRTSMTYRVEAFDLFCRDKLFILDRHLSSAACGQLIRAVRDSAAAGIYCWAAESTYQLSGESAQYLRYLASAARLDPGCPRLERMIRRTKGVLIDTIARELRIDYACRRRGPASPPSRVETRVVDLGRFTSHSYWEGAHVRFTERSVEVRTSRGNGTYSAILPLSIHGIPLTYAVAPCGGQAEPSMLWVRVSYCLAEGEVGICTISQRPGEGDVLIDEAIVGAASGGSHVFLSVGEAGDMPVTGLLIRNGHTKRSSLIEILEVSILMACAHCEMSALADTAPNMVTAPSPLSP